MSSEKIPFNRRQWLKTAGASLATVALASRLPLNGQSSAPHTPPSARPPALVSLSLNENPFGPAPSAQQAMISAVSGSCRYPLGYDRELIGLIAAKENCRPEQIVLGNGSGEILDVAGLHFGLEKGEIVVADPAYMQLVRAAETAGGRAVRVPLNARLEHDLPAIAAAVTARTSVVYIVNPNNPTGTIVNGAALKEFVREVSKRTLVFVDEAYLDCADDYAAQTCAPLVAAGYNVVVARTFSKIHGMAGLRLGYAIMPEKLATALRARMTGGFSLLTLVAALASLRDTDFVADSRAKIKAGRDALIEEVTRLGKRSTVAQGNFAFFQTGMPAQEFAEKMRAEGIVVGRPFPPLLDWARVTIGLPEEMELCHRALRKVLGNA